MTWFSSPTDAADRLGATGYLADAATATTTYLAGALEKPLLVEGPAGVGKTELAKAVARASGADLVRLQCYEGLDEARALYEWNYKKQLLRIQANQGSDATWDETHDDIFTDEFLLTRPLLTAIRREEPTVLLIDEVDKTDVEVEGLLLEVLSDFQVTIPEMGTVTAVRRPFVVLTSNATRELSEAVKRRCLYLHLEYPDAEREREIVVSQVPGLEEAVAVPARGDGGPAARAGAEEGALDRGVRRLGAHPDRPRDQRPRRRRRQRHPGRGAQARLRPGARGQGAAPRPRRALSRCRPPSRRTRPGPGCWTGTSPSSRRCAAAGLPVSLAEDLDAVAVLTALPWDDRAVVREGYAAAVVKRHAQRPTFDALFDLYFPPLVGNGADRLGADEDGADGDQGEVSGGGQDGGEAPVARDNAEALRDFRERLEAAHDRRRRAAAGPARRRGGGPLRRDARARAGAVVLVGLHRAAAGRTRRARRPAGPGPARRGPRRRGGRAAPQRSRSAASPGASRPTPAAGSRRRRVPEHVARTALRPTIDRLDFLQMRRADLEQMRREIYPLARRLATRLTQEHHAQRRGPLDFRRTVRASVSTGGVPLTTHHKPKRPHRSELVVLCDVSGSVANFAQFTLLLVFALREQFTKVRAFTFIDHVHEVTHHFKPGADVVDVMADLAASASHAALWGRTNYGRAIEQVRRAALRRDRPAHLPAGAG